MYLHTHTPVCIHAYMYILYTTIIGLCLTISSHMIKLSVVPTRYYYLHMHMLIMTVTIVMITNVFYHYYYHYYHYYYYHYY